MIAAFVVAVLVAYAATPLARAWALRVGAMDQPGDRKIHAATMPRLGGAAIVIAAAAGLATAAIAGLVTGRPAMHPGALPLSLGALVVFAVGARDDIAGLRPLPKLAGIAAAALVTMAGGVLIERFTLFQQTYELGGLAWPLTLAWIVAVTNAFNLIDGLDGLATGLAIIAATACGMLLLVRGDAQNACILIVLVGAGIGFLPYNFNPATIFLGDSGSLVFGFVLAVTAITGWQKGATALAVGAPIVALALPLADAAGSIVRRAAGRRPIFAPDQQHIHHWLLGRGLSHRAAVLVLYACAIALAVAALLTADYR